MRKLEKTFYVLVLVMVFYSCISRTNKVLEEEYKEDIKELDVVIKRSKELLERMGGTEDVEEEEEEKKEEEEKEGGDKEASKDSLDIKSKDKKRLQSTLGKEIGLDTVRYYKDLFENDKKRDKKKDKQVAEGGLKGDDKGEEGVEKSKESKGEGREGKEEKEEKEEKEGKEEKKLNLEELRAGKISGTNIVDLPKYEEVVVDLAKGMEGGVEGIEKKSSGGVVGGKLFYSSRGYYFEIPSGYKLKTKDEQLLHYRYKGKSAYKGEILIGNVGSTKGLNTQGVLKKIKTEYESKGAIKWGKEVNLEEEIESKGGKEAYSVQGKIYSSNTYREYYIYVLKDRRNSYTFILLYFAIENIEDKVGKDKVGKEKISEEELNKALELYKTFRFY